MCPRGARLFAGRGGLLEKTELVAHCLLVEAKDGLVLVDTGFGTGDVLDPGRLGQPFRSVVGASPKLAETATKQLEALGHEPSDVRHIVITHLDLDHAGGLSDFPQAEVHVFAPELEIARHPGLRDKSRYIPAQWAHGPNWKPHEVDGDAWFGFESVRPIPGLDDQVALVPLVGHTKGHCGVAVQTGDGWVLHCGDAFFFHGEMETPLRCPPGLRVFQNLTQFNRGERLRNRERLRELRREHGSEVRLVCSHDPAMLDTATAA
jgi:glyoxylase-like metal-dependent hydrolase (beta-lactamase superfamily II)